LNLEEAVALLDTDRARASKRSSRLATSCRVSAVHLGLLENPWLLGGLAVGALLQVAVVFWSPLARVFHTVPLGLVEALGLIAVGSVVLWAEEARKLAMRLRVRRRLAGPREALMGRP
jgi:magnesium-transporting ATPase (P-type)